MKKALFYRLFGIGKIPDADRSAIEKEGVRLSDEGIKATITYRDFRKPGSYSNWRRQWFVASIALTETRLLAWRNPAAVIDVPLSDERFQQTAFSTEETGALLIAFDASLFHDDWSGTIEYRFFTPSAPDFLARLTEKQNA